MSRIDELIAELCPDGVKYSELGEIAEYSHNRIDAKEVDESSYVGVDNLLPNKQGKSLSSYVPTEGRLAHFDSGDVLIGNIRPYLKKIWLATHSGGTNGDVLVIQLNDRKKLAPEFLFYILSSDRFFTYDMQNAKGAKMPRGDKVAVMKYKIPIPPLSVQQEIVRILDNFTKLEAELEAELEARKKQFEYYRNTLFAAKDKESWTTLGKIGTNLDYLRKPVIKSQRENGEYPYYGASGIVDYVRDYIFDGDYLLVSEDGANLLARKTPIAFSISGKTWVNNHAHVIKFENKITQRFVELYLNSIDLSKYINTAAQPKITQANLINIEIPLLPDEEQERIVAILDRFDTLVNDITQGLPAEIAARRKQYEYYRDKLLTFKEKVS